MSPSNLFIFPIKYPYTLDEWVSLANRRYYMLQKSTVSKLYAMASTFTFISLLSYTEYYFIYISNKDKINH